MDRMDLYRDIALRTDGDVYIGVVGPVRTGKSTFIKRFMDLMVIPGMDNEFARGRLVDELPQSAAGKTIMTTQPKFVPNEAAVLALDDNMSVRIRMVDCVGYMVPGAAGHTENEAPRMVRTPWFDYDVPFEEAAEIGTKKVISEHSTIGLVITTDGSITQIERESYVLAEERVVRELKEASKPFVIVLNSTYPSSEPTQKLACELAEKYSSPVCPMDVMNMSPHEIMDLFELTLMEFPISSAHISLPSWVSALGSGHWLVERVMTRVKECSDSLYKMADYTVLRDALRDIDGFEEISIKGIELGSGTIKLELRPLENMFYAVLGEECGCEISSDAHLISMIKELVGAKSEYDRIAAALLAANQTGYGLVPPAMDELSLEEPELIQKGGQFGVKMRARASGLHLIRIDIESEIAPIVGSEGQSEEFRQYISSVMHGSPNDVWDVKIFGKPLYDLVKDGMSSKVNRLPDTVQQKLRETLQRMVNDGCSGLICILL